MKDEQKIIQMFQQLPLFKHLTDQELYSVVTLAVTRQYKKGMHVFMQGDPVENVYFLHKGRVKVYKTDINGKEQIVNILKPGDMFPHQGFFRKGDYPAHTEVTEEAVITHIPITSFENFLIQNPEITIKLFRVLGDIIVDLQNRLEEKLLHNTHGQVVLLLVRLAKLHGGQEDLDGWVQLNTVFTNRELANMIGSSRETVNRIIAKLKKKDILKMNDHYMALDVEGLENELI
ncbi:Crp/Fnr family transcriptional regulator [Virgibacillus sp. MSP4-1]|uniref:Crp/Fnr family transcriptional regulator n=1 Tax=Virgibacillus sp. MSP4-1 TaxID=2700081 RepID=UPI0003A0B90D|nr:Crp/Fnr family transcriptional regulator [Virgibacillus sp. MSP4-1]QHS21668.1 Crp/Fnr family transcriptional regulator [Virgibacillus sp. MSP4-1]